MNKSLHFFKRTAVFFCLLFFTFISIARAQKLVQGDIVVIGWDATIDEVRFAALADIPTGTVLKFTDFGWDQTNNAFTASPNADGIITWTLSSRVPKGTVLKFFWGGTGETSVLTNVTAGNVLIPASDLSELRPTTAQDPMNLAGDGVFIYQGSDTNPYFISGFNNSSGTVDANNWNTSIVASARDSQLPNGNGSENALTPGVNAVGMPGGGSQQDVVHYTGETTAADAATWLSRLTDKSKWTGYGSTQSSLINSITIAGPIVNTGSTSSISISGATLNGTANDNGDETTVSFEYGTVSGLSSGVTTVAATTGGSVSAGAGNTSSSVSLTSLSGGTTYYYRIKGVNIKGTSKGEIKSFTTPAIPSVTTVGTLSAFSTCSGTASSAQSFTVSGNNLTTAITVAAPTGYEVSKTSSTTGFNSSVTLTPLSGSVSNATIYVRLKSDASGSPLGNITVSSTGATDKNVAVSGTANFLPTITLGTITSVSTTATSFSLPYTATTGSPNQYSITTGTTAMSDFIAVNNATLGSSPLTVTLPATKTGGTYDFNLILKNSATGCVSSIVPFTLTVNPLSSNADLSGLALSSGSLSPAFDTGTGAYTASVSNAISSITLTPTVSDATATVTIDGTVVTSGSVSESIDLDVGTNTITVLVTAQNGITIKTYTITITRAVPGPNIAVSGTLSAVNTTYGSPSATSTSFTVSGSSLTADITVTPPGGFEVSTSSGSGYGATVTLIPNSGTVNATTVYARLKASATVSGSPYSGNIVVASAGATPQNVATASSTVGAKTLTITGVSISNKQYDGNVTATIGGTAVLSGLLPDDVANVTLGGTPSATFTTAGAGTSKAVTLSGYSISGSASGNYSLTQPIGLTANITAKTISITGNSIADKIYDGNATATISGTAVLNGVLPGDVANVTLGGTPSATFANTSVETGKSVTVSGYSISGSASGNYSLSQPSGLTANITAKLITITGINISNKQYDGNATATISGIAVLNGVLSGDAANVAVGGTSSAMFANASVETGKSVTVSGYSISGSASGNYSLVQPAGLTADITIKTITIAGISINDKIYDGNVTATISGTAALSGVLSGDVANVTLGGTSSAAFTSAGAGIGKAVTVSGYSISGSASGNYSLTQPAGLTANITAKAISITGNGIADKIYDGNATATISGTAALSGVLPGDAASVTLGGTPLATFANASVETGKPVTISGYSISGSASGNYSLTQPAGLTGNITAKSITITGINISNKQYDGNTTATISGTATLNGVLSGDAANVTLGGIPTGTFATAGLGTGKAVIISGYSISGSASGNYNLDQPTGLTANITAKSIAITGINISDKTYDSNTIATISGTATLSGLLPDDVADVTLGGTPSATFTTAGAGTSKAVTVSGYSISGSASGNYSLTQPAGLTANITAKAISITGNGIADKIYDGNATATISGTAALNGVLPGDAASVTLGGTPSATFANTSVEAGKSVTVSGYSISGSASGNYSLSQPSGLTANITAKSITISGINISNKEYDGNATATISGTAALSGVLSGDAANVTLDGIPTGTFATAGLGTGKAVIISGYSINGSASGNYSLTQPAGLTANITAKTITITGINISDKQYDGNVTATISGTAALSGVLPGDVANVTLGGIPTGTFATVGAGIGKAVTLSGYSISGSASGNYSLTQPAGLTADITAKAISITGNGIADKIYDGNATATISGTAALNGVLPGDAASVILGGTPLATFANASVETGKPVTVSGYSISGSASGNYSLTQPAGLTADITAKTITITGINISNKEYDGNATATISGTAALSGVLSGDVANVTLDGIPTGTFATAGLGTGKAVTISGYSINGSASGNYSLTQPAGLTANITAKTITITGINISDKQYDGNVTATISGTAALSGVLPGDVANVTLGGIPTGTFATVGAGIGKAVTLSGYSISGSASGNYSLTQPAGLTADITAKAISITGNVIADKIYDGNTTATISGTAALNGVLPGDAASVTLGGTPLATFANASVETGKPVTVSGYSISGSASGNYSLTQPAGLTADITAKTITITGINISNKEYDGNVTATISGTAALNGVLSGDVANVTLGGVPTGTFATAGLGTAKSVTISGYSISGSASGNYSLTQPAGLTASITAKSITITGINISNKQYDGNTTAMISGTAALSGVLPGDVANVTLGGIPTGTFATVGAGIGKAVTLSGYSISGSASGNYSLTQPAGLTANITAKAISITGNSIADKIYDGNATATIIGTAALSGVLPGDAASVILGGTPLATFANTSVETGKPVTISGYSISGSASGNYSLSQPGGLTANITAKSITITGINISNKQYDGNTTATISGTAALSGVLSGDAANVTLGDTPAATFATAGLGTAKSVTISGYSISGSASGNYSLTQPIGLTADITAKILTISAQPVSKVYDGNTTATLNFDTFDMASGLVGNEDVSLIYASATYDTKNVGTGKAITISGLALSGIDKDNYRLNTFSTNGEITTKSLTASVIGTVSKVYDGAVTATLASANYSLSGVLSGDAVVLNNPTSGSYDTRNIGTGKIVTVNGLSISGTNAANYSLGSTSISGAVGTITTKNLTASLTGIVSKIYDGTTVAGLNASNYILSGVVPGETVVLNNPTSGSYDNRNAGAGKTVTVNGLSISGIDGASYSLASTNINGTVGTITAKALTITADNKEKFLGTANPELTVRYDGFVTGEESNVLSTQPSIVTTADINSGLGDYPITASGAVAQNYNISYIGGILSIKPGAPTSVGLAAVTLYEHKPAGTLVGTLNSTSNDPNAVFTYSLVAGTGDADNVDFNIVNNELRTVTPLNYEAQQNYKIRVRSTTQYGFSLDQDFVIQLNDVNEAPTLNAIENQIICYNKDEQRINLSGITAGPDVNQTTTLSVLSNTNSLFQNLSIAGNQLRYTIANNQSGTAVVTLTVKDNGGTANGGVNEISRSFTITVNPLPVITITSDKGNSISRGESVVLTASGGVKYKWTTLGAIGGKETSQFLVRPLSTTTYVVTAETAGGCVAEASFKVEVKGDYQAIEAENFITPNGDGVNDTWVVKNIDAYPAHTLTIVDRAGRIVYKVRNYKNDWDGRLNASLLQEGTYYYLFRFDQPNVRVMKGFITIVR